MSFTSHTASQGIYCADELRKDPVFAAVLDKPSLASQPTLSRFFKHMDECTLEQFDDIAREMRCRVYSCQMPKMMVFDLDSSLLET